METFFSLKNKNHVDMIGHNRIFVDRRIISLRKILNLSLDNLTNREEQSPSPTYLCKDFAAFLRAHSHKICALLPIIKSP